MAKKTQNEVIIEKFNTLQSSYDDQYLVSLDLKNYMDALKSSNAIKNYSHPYVNAIGGIDPFLLQGVMNGQPSGDKGLKQVYNTFNNAQLTSLTPLVKMYTRKNKKYTPIPLQNVHNEYKVLENPDNKGAVLGLKDMTITVKGNSPETKRSDIDAQITFFGSSLAVFQNNKEYVKLIVPHYGDKHGVSSDLLLQVGWNLPSAHAQRALEFTQVQKKALNLQIQNYILSYTGHNFNFNIDGSFTLTVDYVSRIDDMIRGANFLSTTTKMDEIYSDQTKAPAKMSDEIEAQIANFLKQYHSEDTTVRKKKITKHIKAKGSKEVAERISKASEQMSAFSADLLGQLTKNVPFVTFQVPVRKINTLQFVLAIKRTLGTATLQQVFEYSRELLDPAVNDGHEIISFRKFFDASDASIVYANGIEIPAKLQESYNLSTQNDSAQSVNFDINTIQTTEEFKHNKFIKVTTFGAIITAFVKNNESISAKLKEENIRILLGTIKYKTGDKSEIISLYDIPVTFGTIRKALLECFVSKVKTKLTLTTFMSAMMKKIREYFLEGDFVLDSGNLLGANNLRSAQIVTSAEGMKKFMKNPTSGAVRTGARAIPSKEIASAYLLTAGPASDSPAFTPDSYVAGAQKSIVKKVNFTQANLAVMQSIRDDNITNAFRDGNELGVLPQLYNVDMETIGNINFSPGYIFNLTPTVIGISAVAKRNVLEALGVLGTIMTLKVEHKIGLEGFSTRLSGFNISTKKYINKQLRK